MITRRAIENLRGILDRVNWRLDWAQGEDGVEAAEGKGV
jgi:hypothetical protein